MATIATTIKMYDGVSSTMSDIQRSLEKTVSSFENMKIASDGSIDPSVPQEDKQACA